MSRLPPSSSASRPLRPRSRGGVGGVLFGLVGLASAGLAYLVVDWMDGAAPAFDHRRTSLEAPTTAARETTLPPPSPATDPGSPAGDVRTREATPPATVEPPIDSPLAAVEILPSGAAPAPAMPSVADAASGGHGPELAEVALPVPAVAPAAQVPAADPGTVAPAPSPDTRSADTRPQGAPGPDIPESAGLPIEAAAAPTVTGSTATAPVQEGTGTKAATTRAAAAKTARKPAAAIRQAGKAKTTVRDPSTTGAIRPARGKRFVPEETAAPPEPEPVKPPPGPPSFSNLIDAFVNPEKGRRPTTP